MHFVLKSASFNIALAALSVPMMGDEWNMFRGPNGSGLSSKLGVPNDLRRCECCLENRIRKRWFVAGRS